MTIGRFGPVFPGLLFAAATVLAGPVLAQGGPPEGRGGGPPAHAQGNNGNNGNQGNIGNGNGNRGAPAAIVADDGLEGAIRTVGDIIEDILGYDPVALESDSGGGLPPGLAGRDRLPPGLERQLRETGSLPPGLQRQLEGRIGDRLGRPVEIENDTIRIFDPVTGEVERVLDGILAFGELLERLGS